MQRANLRGWSVVSWDITVPYLAGETDRREIDEMRCKVPKPDNKSNLRSGIKENASFRSARRPCRMSGGLGIGDGGRCWDKAPSSKLPQSSMPFWV